MGSKVRFVVLLFLLVFSLPRVYSQACGNGTFTINFYTRQGLQGINITKLEYKIYRIDEDLDYFRYVYTDRQMDLVHGSVIDNDLVEIYLKKHPNIEEYYLRKNPDPDGFPFIKDTKSSPTQIIVDGILEFSTIESAYTPCLLKVSYGSKYFYIIANLYGGCNRSSDVIIRDQDAVIVIPKDYRI